MADFPKWWVKVGTEAKHIADVAEAKRAIFKYAETLEKVARSEDDDAILLAAAAIPKPKGQA